MIKSFKPLINEHSKILILGSMHGVKSLEAVEYYAHTQNRFWKIMAVFCKYPNLEKQSYDIKTKALLNNNIALWDVVKSCEREGSLDTNIQNIKTNNISALLKKYTNIKQIGCNGSKSFELFNKHFKNTNIPVIQLPSTSPANAKYSLDKLLEEWTNKCSIFSR